MDTDKARELLDRRDEIDRELQQLFNGGKERKQVVCGSCQQPGHNARACPQKKA